eukprot:COSAG03_NODE_633_length_6609_cov_73.574808_4_plen_133_part_00
MNGHAIGGVSCSRYSSFRSEVFCAVAELSCSVYVRAAVPDMLFERVVKCELGMISKCWLFDKEERIPVDLHALQQVGGAKLLDLLSDASNAASAGVVAADMAAHNMAVTHQEKSDWESAAALAIASIAPSSG